MWIREDVVQRMLELGRECPSWQGAAMLFLTSYVFLLRLPSEALKIAVGNRVAKGGVEAAITMKATLWCSAC